MLIIVTILFCVYVLEKEEEELEQKNASLLANADETVLPSPDRIIYKNEKNEYVILYPDTKEYAQIYSELYNRTINTIEGKVFSEEEIAKMQEEGSFIEFDYDTKSKNFVFMLEEKEIGIIKRFSDSGQVIKTSLTDLDSLIQTIDELTKDKEKYEFNKEYNYISENKLNELPSNLGFPQVRVGIYQKIIKSNQDNYKEILTTLNFKTNQELPDINFDKQTLIITISQYEITSVNQNVGNIKYKFGDLSNEYTVNVLVVSKIVNINCIYYNTNDNSSLNNNEISKYVKTTTSGIITEISSDSIKVGLTSELSTHIINIDENTIIKNYTNDSMLSVSNLKVGDCIYVEGEISKDRENLKVINSEKIDIFEKNLLKKEAEKFLKDTYRIDGMSIEYYNVNEAGSGYIIVACSYENFIYPIKVNVNSQTETYLGMGYHLQSNYGYVLHEMCDITLDTKIVDIDSVKGYVKTIEYIAD